MTKYRTKTIVIEAEIYTFGMEEGFSCIPYVVKCEWKNPMGRYKDCGRCKLDVPKKPFITTHEGHHYYINAGDWIITDVNGVRYPCKPDIFDAMYEAVE